MVNDTMTDMGTAADQVEPKDREWLFALLPTVPPLLLILRIWYFSDEDIDNTRLVIQDISPIGLITALLPTLLWMLPAVALAFTAAVPAVIVLEFGRIPILPVMAVEVGGAAAGQVLSGYIISMDERMTTFLDLKGRLRFVANDSIVSETSCRDYSRAPYTDVTLRGLTIEESILEADGSARRRQPIDQRCYGRTAG